MSQSASDVLDRALMALGIAFAIAETSAKTGMPVADAYVAILRRIMGKLSGERLHTQDVDIPADPEPGDITPDIPLAWTTVDGDMTRVALCIGEIAFIPLWFLNGAWEPEYDSAYPGFIQGFTTRQAAFVALRAPLEEHHDEPLPPGSDR